MESGGDASPCDDVGVTFTGVVWKCRWLIVVALCLYLTFGLFIGFVILPTCVVLFIIGFLWPFITNKDPRLELLSSNKLSRGLYDYTEYQKYIKKASNDVSSDPAVKNLLKNSQKQKIETGLEHLDTELNEVLDLVLRDFIHSWYDKLLPQFIGNFPQEADRDHEQLFPEAVRSVANHISCGMVARLRAVNKMTPMVNFLTTDVVEIIKVHVGLYRQADQRIPRPVKPVIDKEVQEIRNSEVRSLFFDLEARRSAMENRDVGGRRCRDFIAQDDRAFSDYLRSITDALLLAFLPPDEFKCRPVRHAMREILVTQALKPTFDSICSADYMNTFLVRYTPLESGVPAHVGVSSEAFCEMVRHCCSMEELDAIIAFAQDERVILQSQDNSGDSLSTKKQLTAVNYLISECTRRIEHLKSLGFRESASSSSAKYYPSSGSFANRSSNSNFRSFDDDGVPQEFSMGGDVSQTDSERRKTKLLRRQKSTEVVVSPGSLSLRQILDSYHDEFFNYLKRVNASRFLDFYDNVQAFRTTVDEVNSYRDERMMAAQFTTGDRSLAPSSREVKSLETMRDYAEFLLDAYEKLAQETRNSIAYNFKVDASSVRDLKQKIQNKSLEPQFDWFDRMSEQAYNFMRTHKKLYPSFVVSRSYRQMILNPREGSRAAAGFYSSSSSNENLMKSPDHSETDEITSSISTLKYDGDVFNAHLGEEVSASCGLSANIVNYQIRDEGKRHGVYEVEVETSLLSDWTKSDGAPQVFKIYRRYSDFAKLYEELKKKYSSVDGMKFPPKAMTTSLSEKLMIKRKDQLGAFLQEILSPEIISTNPGMLQIVHNFLSQDYVAEKAPKESHSKLERSVSAASVSSSVRYQSSMSTSSLANDLNSLDENVEIGAGNRGIVASVYRNRSFRDSTGSISSVFASSNSEQELAPEILKPLIDLFFEIFDVKAGRGGDSNVVRDQLAHAISRMLRATFGDRINRKIVKLVSSYMTEDAICGYIGNLRESFWPQGHRTVAPEPKSIQDRYRTKFMAKVKLYGSISSEIKSLPFVTQEVTRRGVFRLVKLFQDEQLNRRLIVAIFEELLLVIFPDLKMKEILDRIYLQSPRVKTTMTSQ